MDGGGISRNPIPDKIIYTDAATETMILPILVFDKCEFSATGIIPDAYYDVASGEWAALFSETNLNYGLELLGAPQTVADPMIDICRKSTTFYIDKTRKLR